MAANGLGDLSGGSPRNLLEVPCVWDALLVGAAAGLAVAAHRYRGSRNLVSATDWGVKMSCLTSIVSFGICRKQFHEAQDQVRMSLQHLKKAREGQMDRPTEEQK